MTCLLKGLRRSLELGAFTKGEYLFLSHRGKDQWSPSGTRSNTVHANAVLYAELREALCKAHQGCLRRRVRSHSSFASKAWMEHELMIAPSRLHLRRRRLCKEEGSINVGPKRLVELLFRDVGELRVRSLKGGIVDKDVQSAELLNCAVYKSEDRFSTKRREVNALPGRHAAAYRSVANPEANFRLAERRESDAGRSGAALQGLLLPLEYPLLDDAPLPIRIQG